MENILTFSYKNFLTKEELKKIEFTNIWNYLLLQVRIFERKKKCQHLIEEKMTTIRMELRFDRLSEIFSTKTLMYVELKTSLKVLLAEDIHRITSRY